jgi:hypothetical protein
MAYRFLIQSLNVPVPERTWIWINPWTSGDIYLQMALLQPFREEYLREGEQMLILVESRFAEIVEMFSQYSHCLLLRVTETLTPHYRLCLSIKNLSKILLPGVPRIFLPHFYPDGNLLRFAHLRQISMAELAKYMLNLPFDAPLAKPVIPDGFVQRAQAIVEKFAISPGKSVLLSPHTVTLHPQPATFWEELAKRLFAAGLSVFTDTANGRFPAIQGTQGLPFSFGEAVPLVSTMGYVIAQHSGFVNVISSATCRLSVIYRGPLPVNLPDETYALPYSAIDLQNNGFRETHDALGIHRQADPVVAAGLVVDRFLSHS